ncbi:MAG: ANTAR domain-containing protein [Gemmataceae bacterium]
MHPSAATTSPLRLVVVEDDETVRLGLVETLERAFGHRVVGQAANGLEMLDVLGRVEADVVVFDIHLPQLNGIDALRRFLETRPIAAVALTGDRDPSQLRKAVHEGIHGYLIKPVDPYQLGPAIEVARARFEDIRRLTDENDKLQKSLENRKTIERAKGVLMRRHRWTEADAFRRLQRAAMNKRTTMVDLARQVLDGKELDL